MDKSKSPHLQTPGEREEFLNNSLLLPPTLTDIFNISFALIPVLHNIVIKDTLPLVDSQLVQNTCHPALQPDTIQIY